MSVIVLDDNGYCSSDRYDSSRACGNENYSKIKELSVVLNGRREEDERLLREAAANLSGSITSLHEELNYTQNSVDLLEEVKTSFRTPEKTPKRNKPSRDSDSSIEVIEPSEAALRTPGKKSKRKRSLSESDESLSEDRYCDSPEIPLSTPVIYQLAESNSTKITIKKIMSKKPEVRPKKCSDNDITSLLDADDDDDEPIFEVKKKNIETPGTPSRSLRHTAKVVEANTPRSSPRTRGKTRETPQREEGSLRIKLRRSTEQSNYKVELDFDSRERRASLRTKILLPKRYADMEMEVETETEEEKPARKTPSKSVKSAQYREEPETDELAGTPKKLTRTRATRNPEEDKPGRRTPSRSTKPVQYYEGPADAAETPRKSTRQTKAAENKEERPVRRTPSRSAKPAHFYEEFTDLDESMESPKKSTRENIEKEMHTPSRTRSTQPRTPSSSILKSVATTPSGRPRRSTRFVTQNLDYNEEEGNENDTNRGNKSDDSDIEGLTRHLIDRKRRLITEDKHMTPKKSTTMVEEAKTPKKSVTIVEDAKTPRKTPRRAATISEEVSTPKRATRQASADDEPVTPKTRGRASKPQTPSLKHGSLTPSMHQRSANVGKPKTALEEARAQLHVSAVPKSLPCREEEFNDIFTFLQRKLLDHSSGCIYISGVPGTGKTATVNEVIRCLRKLVSKRELDEFDFIEINGMKLTEPRQAYVQIFKQLSGRSLTWEQAHQNLERKFTKSTGHRPMTLLLVDELDLLCNKRQDVVYNLLDWPAKQGAQLVVITIANTMDLPERVLMGRVTSRLGLTRLTFQPYNHKQLQEIVTTRLKDSDAFRSEAIQLVARKVAAVSGDARRALDICRRATEIAEAHDGKTVSMQDVNEALTEMIASAKVQAIRHCSEMEKVFLQAVCAEITRTGVEEASFLSVYKQFDALCSFEGVKTPNVTQTLEICARLSANRLLLCEHSRNDIMQRILLNVSTDDVHFSLQNIEI